MSDHDRDAYAIRWSAPTGSVGDPVWRGPHPDAETTRSVSERRDPAFAAPSGNASRRDASSPSSFSIPGRPTGSTPAGWAGPQGDTADSISARHPSGSDGWSDAAGVARFDAPDRGDHAPRRGDVASRDAGPSSYADAPHSGSTGNGAPWSSTMYPSDPPQVVRQHDDLSDDSLTIGRSRSNSIVLDDMLVSRRHVVITADDEGLLLRDMGSRNGTFVNGRRVEQTHLHEGDRIGIGASTFEVRDGWLVSV